MPTYMYKAMTKHGQIVKNKMTETSKMECMKRLKKNDLVPISIVPTVAVNKREKKGPRNHRGFNKELKKIGKQRLKTKTENKQTLRNKIHSKLLGGRKENYFERY